MPKTLKHIWQKITCYDNLYGAWIDARHRKRFKQDSLVFGRFVEDNLLDIQGQLLHKTWEPGPLHEFICHEPKLRLIQAPQFRDRVVHHAYVRVINPAFERRFISDSYACRKGKGTLAASERLTAMLRSAAATGKSVYVLKADISKYFPNIRHDILFDIYKRVVSDKDALWLIGQQIYHSGFEKSGLPIGALPSQLSANAYLDVFDHWMKDYMGVRWYVRYMDDWIVIANDKVYLQKLVAQAAEFLWDTLCLTLNPKTTIFPASHGVDFAGYRHWTDHRLPRKRIVKHARRTMRRMMGLYSEYKIDLDYVRARLMSFLGYMKWCDGWNTLNHILGNFCLTRNREELLCQNLPIN